MSICPRRNEKHPRLPSSTPPIGRSSTPIVLSLLFAAATAQLALANDNSNDNSTTVTTREVSTRVVEWDLQELDDVSPDTMPGALTLESGRSSTNNVWFVTRAIQPRVYRLEIPRGLRVRNAPWRSWTLHPDDASPTGGLKRVRSSWDHRVVFVKTTFGLNRIDTTTNQVVFYANAGTSAEGASDVAVDPANKVYWAANGFIKRINANAGCSQYPCPPAEFVTWQVGGSVGECFEDATGSGNIPCLSGIAVHPKSSYLVYFSDNVGNRIGELDTKYNKVRYWNLADPALMTNVNGSSDAPEGPRQLNVEDDGTVWVVTGSGHVVSIDTKTNYVAKHKIPAVATNDPWGVAPDGGMIGYTDIEDLGTNHKVAMLIPKNRPVRVSPTSQAAPRDQQAVACVADTAESKYGEAQPIRRTVPTRITRKSDGTFVEAFVDKNQGMEINESRLPAGIAPDLHRGTGAFFYAVGEPTSSTFAVKRIGHTRLPRDREKGKHDRDDEDFDDDDKRRGHDDDDDDDGVKNDIDSDDDGDGYMDFEDDDDDNDGIKNEHDTKDGKEDQHSHRSQLAMSQSEEFEATALPGALALIVLALADNPLSSLSIEVRNAAGTVVGNSFATPGTGLITLAAPAAGTYIVKVTNHAPSVSGIGTTIITRHPWLP